MNVFSKVKNLILDAIFPHQCLCGRWGEALCQTCYEKIPQTKTQLCPICKKLSENGKTCTSCRHKSNLTGVMIFGDHENILKDAIWQYKYNLIRQLSIPLSKLLIDRFGKIVSDKKFIVTFIPTSKQRNRWRGFNQSKLIAENLSKELGLSIDDLLKKTKRAKPQVGLSRKERIKNLKGKFSLNEKVTKGYLENKKILVVDDVYTTGTTLEECAKVLRQAGAREVWGIVLSRD